MGVVWVKIATASNISFDISKEEGIGCYSLKGPGDKR